jgi:hypothetical protein
MSLVFFYPANIPVFESIKLSGWQVQSEAAAFAYTLMPD